MKDDNLLNCGHNDFRSVIRLCLNDVRGISQLRTALEFFAAKYEDTELLSWCDKYSEFVKKYFIVGD